MKKLLTAVSLALSALLTSPAHSETLTVGDYTIDAEVARTRSELERGLMFRKSLAENSGMVFIFDPAAHVCMWMKNTLIPLSVAFVDGSGRIINIEEMQPETLELHCAKSAATYALEMNAGWFSKRGIAPGTEITGLPKVRR